jgi:CheY-like chemotaxis protein
LKHDLSMRHIPVFVVSTVDHPERGLQLGAQGVLPKPIQTAQRLDQFLEQILETVSRTERNVLIVEPDHARADEMVALLSQLDAPQVKVHSVASGAEALEELRKEQIDCVVLTPQLPDMRLATLAAEISAIDSPKGSPVVVLYTQPDLPAEETDRWKRLAGEFNLRHVDSLANLTDQVTFALCQPIAKLPDPHRKMVQDACNPAPKLARKKVLIVDDDIRNIFALTSVLERYDIVTVSAETGRDAINLLQAATDVDIVLMDIMMPEMDGIDTIKAIRQISRFKRLPIIAVTAKAMKGDRDKCIEAGAWDYLSKPVDPDQMLSALNAWLTE